MEQKKCREENCMMWADGDHLLCEEHRRKLYPAAPEKRYDFSVERFRQIFSRPGRRGVVVPKPAQESEAVQLATQIFS